MSDCGGGVNDDITIDDDNDEDINKKNVVKKPVVKKRRSRIFNPQWEVSYGFLQKDKNKSICTLCNITIISRAYNIRRHFRQLHESKLNGSFNGEPSSSLSDHIRDQVRKFKESYPNYRLVVPANSSNAKVYNTIWTLKYGFVMKDKQNSVCTICYEMVASKSSLIETHYKDRHHTSLRHLTKDSLREYLQDSVKVFNDYHSYRTSADAPTTFESRKASFIVAFTVAKMDKTAGEGEYLRDCFLQISDILFANYPNKDEIRSDLEKMSVSRFSVRRHIDTIVDDINQQLREDLERCQAFSIRLDQSVSRKDVTRLAISVRFYSEHFDRTIEEVLTIGKINNGESGKESDSLQLVHSIVQKFSLHSKLFSICVDGARSATAQIFIRQLQQQLNRQLLIFNSSISQRDIFVSMLKPSNEPLTLNVNCTPPSVDCLRMLKFVLFPEQFHYNNLEGNFFDFEFFKFLNIEHFYDELGMVIANPELIQQSERMRQQIFDLQVNGNVLEIVHNFWNRYLSKSTFPSIYKVFSCLMSIIGDSSCGESSSTSSSKSKPGDHLFQKSIINNSSSLNGCRNRLKMNHTEDSIRLQLTNYSPDFDRILLGVYRKRKPGINTMESQGATLSGIDPICILPSQHIVPVDNSNIIDSDLMSSIPNTSPIPKLVHLETRNG